MCPCAAAWLLLQPHAHSWPPMRTHLQVTHSANVNIHETIDTDAKVRLRCAHCTCPAGRARLGAPLHTCTNPETQTVTRAVLPIVKTCLFCPCCCACQVHAIHENAEVFDAKAEGVFKYLQVGRAEGHSHPMCWWWWRVPPMRANGEPSLRLGLPSHLQVFTACANSFAHGSNDVANSIGPYAAIYSVWQTASVASEAEVPTCE